MVNLSRFPKFISKLWLNKLCSFSFAISFWWGWLLLKFWVENLSCIWKTEFLPKYIAPFTMIWLAKRKSTQNKYALKNQWFVYFSLLQSETELQVVVKDSWVYNKHNYYNLYYAYIKYIEFWLITKCILRIFVSDKIPKSNCVIWDLHFTFMLQIIRLMQPHSTVMFYNIFY